MKRKTTRKLSWQMFRVSLKGFSNVYPTKWTICFCSNFPMPVSQIIQKEEFRIHIKTPCISLWRIKVGVGPHPSLSGHLKLNTNSRLVNLYFLKFSSSWFNVEALVYCLKLTPILLDIIRTQAWVNRIFRTTSAILYNKFCFGSKRSVG